MTDLKTVQSTEALAAFLKTVNVFREQAPDVLEEIASQGIVRDFVPEENVFSKGDPGTAIYVVLNGTVRVHDGDMTLNYLGEQDVFGEMAVLDSQPRSASVTAVVPSQLFEIDRDTFLHFVSKSPEIMGALMQVFSRHLRGRVADMKADFEYMRQFNRVTGAAVAVEAGIYEPESLDEVAERTDELGQLARVFRRMVREVYAREQRFKAEIAALHIEVDEAKKAKQVAEITETDYFHDLQQRAASLRSARRSDSA